MESEKAGAGRDGRTRLCETKFSGANVDMEIFIFPAQPADHEQDWQPYNRLIHTLLHVMTIPTYRDTCVDIFRNVESQDSTYAFRRQKDRLIFCGFVKTQHSFVSKCVLEGIHRGRFTRFWAPPHSRSGFINRYRTSNFSRFLRWKMDKSERGAKCRSSDAHREPSLYFAPQT